MGGLSGLEVVLGRWGRGGAWLSGSGGLSVVGLVLVSFTWRCFAHEGPRLPLAWARFSFCFQSIWRWLCWPSVSKEEEEEEEEEEEIHLPYMESYMTTT